MSVGPKILFQKIVAALPTPLVANTLYHVRTGAGFDVYVTNATGTIVAYPLNGLRSFGASGGLGAARVYAGSTKTLADGSWSIDLTPAGFTTVLAVVPSAVAASALLSGAAQATLEAKTAAKANGHVVLPVASLSLSNPAIVFAPAGVEVDVIAIGV